MNTVGLLSTVTAADLEAAFQQPQRIKHETPRRHAHTQYHRKNKGYR
jgi:hypothetical protein